MTDKLTWVSREGEILYYDNTSRLSSLETGDKIHSLATQPPPPPLTPRHVISLAFVSCFICLFIYMIGELWSGTKHRFKDGLIVSLRYLV